MGWDGMDEEGPTRHSRARVVVVERSSRASRRERDARARGDGDGDDASVGEEEES